MTIINAGILAYQPTTLQLAVPKSAVLYRYSRGVPTSSVKVKVIDTSPVALAAGIHGFRVEFPGIQSKFDLEFSLTPRGKGVAVPLVSADKDPWPPPPPFSALFGISNNEWDIIWRQVPAAVLGAETPVEARMFLANAAQGFQAALKRLKDARRGGKYWYRYRYSR